jgi:hypothetical protein
MDERRELLKRIGRGVQIAAFAGSSQIIEAPKTYSTDLLEPPSAAELLVQSQRLSIEQRFGVRLLTLDEFSIRNGYDPTFMVSFSKDWTPDKLGFVETLLSNTPPHFYEPAEDGKPLDLVLFSEKAGRAGITCFNENCEDEGFIALSAQDDIHRDRHPTVLTTINLNDYEMALTVLTHELVHRRTPISFRDFSAKKDPYNLYGRVYVSPWFDKVDSILGQPFSEMADNLHQSAGDAEEHFKLTHSIESDSNPQELSLEQLNEYNFYYYFKYGVSLKIPIEFLAVMGQNYIRGREFFVRNYSKFFSEEIAESLFEFTGADIFRGFEYQDMFLTRGQKSSDLGKSVKRPDSIALELQQN